MDQSSWTQNPFLEFRPTNPPAAKYLSESQAFVTDSSLRIHPTLLDLTLARRGIGPVSFSLSMQPSHLFPIQEPVKNPTSNVAHLSRSLNASDRVQLEIGRAWMGVILSLSPNISACTRLDVTERPLIFITGRDFPHSSRVTLIYRSDLQSRRWIPSPSNRRSGRSHSQR